MANAATRSAKMRQVMRDAYDGQGIAESYARNNELLNAEDFIFSYFRNELDNKSILDVGVGTGRTIPCLTSLTSHYTGIDYSESMLRCCREKYAEVKLFQCDARTMDQFCDESFDVAIASWNVLDDSDHNDRLKILGEVHRVLRPKGMFIFSSHNRDSKTRSAYRFRGFVKAPNPVDLIKFNAIRVKRYVTGILHHWDRGRGETQNPKYAIINDSSHNYRLLTYYIRKEAQIEQLESIGFSDVQLVDESGSFIRLDEQCSDGWIYYICRKEVGSRI